MLSIDRMLRVQVLLLLALAAIAAEPPVGDTGLAELAGQRARVAVIAGDGEKSVQRIDEPDEPAEKKRIRFAVAADGRYDIVLTDPTDPAGERTRLVSDGTTACDQSQETVDSTPLVHRRPATADLAARLFACLRLDAAQLRRDYAVELVAAADHQRELRLTPTDPAVLREISSIVVTIDPAGHPVRLVLDDPSGNRHRLVIATFQDDPPLDPVWFSIPSRP